MDALYAERELCQAIVNHGRDYLVRVKGNQPEVLAALADGFAGEDLGKVVELSPGNPEELISVGSYARIRTLTAVPGCAG